MSTPKQGVYIGGPLDGNVVEFPAMFGDLPVPGTVEIKNGWYIEYYNYDDEVDEQGRRVLRVVPEPTPWKNGFEKKFKIYRGEQDREEFERDSNE